MVGEALDRVLEAAPRPRSITVDHGTEFQSRALEDWAPSEFVAQRQVMTTTEAAPV